MICFFFTLNNLCPANFLPCILLVFFTFLFFVINIFFCQKAPRSKFFVLFFTCILCKGLLYFVTVAFELVLWSTVAFSFFFVYLGLLGKFSMLFHCFFFLYSLLSHFFLFIFLSAAQLISVDTEEQKNNVE